MPKAYLNSTAPSGYFGLSFCFFLPERGVAGSHLLLIDSQLNSVVKVRWNGRSHLSALSVMSWQNHASEKSVELSWRSHLPNTDLHVTVTDFDRTVLRLVTPRDGGGCVTSFALKSRTSVSPWASEQLAYFKLPKTDPVRAAHGDICL